MMYDWRNGYSYGWDAWNWIFMAVMMALFFLGVILLIRFFGGEWRKSKHIDTPLEALKLRYAKGEIDKKEFEEKKKDLAS